MRITICAVMVVLSTVLTGCIPIGFKAQTQFAQASDASAVRQPQIGVVAQNESGERR